MASAEDRSAEALAREPGFAEMSAVRERRVHALDPGLLFHQNHRLVDGIEALYRLFHPSRPSP